MRSCNMYLFIATSIFLSFFLNGCNNSNADTFEKKKEVVKPVKAMKIKDEKSKSVQKFPAVVKSSKEVKISFRIGGPISSFSLETGEKLNKGDIIAKIDERDYILKIKSINARLDAARAKLKDAELQFNRYKSLLEQNAAPKAKFDQVEAGYLAGKSNTKALEKELEAAKNSLKDTKLKAPFTGYVNRIFSEKHETVAPGQPIISLIDLNEMELETFIPEKLISKTKNFTDFKFSLTTFPDTSFYAKLKEIGQKATGAGQTYPLILKIDNKNNLIRPGMSAIVEFSIKNNGIKKYYDIPISSVLSRENKSSIVWKIKDNRAKKTDIEIVRILNQREARVTGDLNKGDLIITAGAGFIKENQAVEIVDSASPTNIGNEL